MRRPSALLLALALASGGCSFLYQSEPPAGCTGDEDADDDGHRALACGGDDCDDTNPAIHPGQPELCTATALIEDDGVDEDCNPNTTSPDPDGDRHYDWNCYNEDPDGVVIWGDDCNNDGSDPNARTAFEGATEICNGVDDDCDPFVDEDLPTTTYIEDCDEDGFGANDEGETLASCGDPNEVPDNAPATCEGGGRWVSRDGDCDDYDDTRQLSCGSCANVDILFVVDDSPSMLEEQASLAAVLPAMLSRLASGDVDGDGVPDKEPIESIQIGVLSPNMGTVGVDRPECPGGQFGGDDGILRTEIGLTQAEVTGLGQSFYESCARGLDDAPSFVEYLPRPGEAPPDDVVLDMRCRALTGTQGCEYEAPLEAALRATTPARSNLRFFSANDSELGHGDGANRGFLREDSLLIVVVISDEDDCSIADPAFFSASGSEGLPEITCAIDGAAELHSLSRYVSGLLALRPAEDLIFGAVVGVPEPLLTEPLDFFSILDDSRMVVRPNPDGTGLESSCTVAGPRGDPATPPRRIVRLAAELASRGGEVALSSICQPGRYMTLVEGLLHAALVRGGERCAFDNGN